MFKEKSDHEQIVTAELSENNENIRSSIESATAFLKIKNEELKEVEEKIS